MPATQAFRNLEVKTPLGPDTLLVQRVSGTEQLSRPFEYQLEMFSDDSNIAHEALLGKPVTVRLTLPEGGERFFNGVVSEFNYAGSEYDAAIYHATIRPWFWLLSHSADCRTFQDKTVPDIVKELFGEHGFSDFEEKLSGSYRNWTYCVQYRESTFNFISRLLEQEGIYYYFKHEDGKHTMVLSDSYASHEPFPDYASVPYFPPDIQDHRKRDHVDSWSQSKQVLTGQYTLRDFDFKSPKADLTTQLPIIRGHERADAEYYDYPGEYSDFEGEASENGAKLGQGQNYVQQRIEERAAQHAIASGGGNACGLCCGYLFTLEDHPRGDQNIEYLISSTHIELASDTYRSSGSGDEKVQHCNVTAIPAAEPYRAPRITAKPHVQGPQTATIVGPAGEEIWTDKYARVLVQFHWDRIGAFDEKSSCWVRVSQAWAGKQWGAIHIPRIGQEVIVDFLEGDPDKPIVTGRVYNNDNMPPYTLPDNKTQSGIKSRSSKGGSPANFNEFRFEDKIGEEQVFLHAEKNQDIEVENDETHWVGHDRRKTIDNDETNAIGRDRSESVGRDEQISISRHRSESVGKNETISIGENRNESVGKNESITIAKNREESVGDNETVNIGKNRTHQIGKNDSLDVGKILTMVAGDQVIIKTGSASIVMKKNGDITISGKNITMKASGKITGKASGAVALKGSKVQQN